jgi:hypothetical protein
LKNMTVNNNIIPDAVFDGNTVAYFGRFDHSIR